MRREWMEPVIEFRNLLQMSMWRLVEIVERFISLNVMPEIKIYILSILITFMLIQITMTSGMKAMKSWVAIMPVVLLTKHLYVTTF